MFCDLFAWAGHPRTEARGAGGIERVPAHEVRMELRKFTDDLAVWANGNLIRSEPDLRAIAHVVADAHHRLQWIHPFRDTNGRTGRVFDHGLLWATYGLSGETLEDSPVVEYFPDATSEDDYFDGLEEADLGRPERLRRFYETRLEAALQP
jgi:fido (protein-threonine AMPylation protein)